jgi:hypothetical protein
MRFTIKKNKLLAVALFAAQFIAQASEEIDGNQRVAVSMTAAAAAAALQVLAHKRNPDGTNAAEPWTPNRPPRKEE